jgi:Putative zinc-finger
MALVPAQLGCGARSATPRGRDTPARTGCNQHASAAAARGAHSEGRAGLQRGRGVWRAAAVSRPSASASPSWPCSSSTRARAVLHRRVSPKMTYPIGMTCQELVELVTDYLEGTLSAELRGRFEEHLAVCPVARTTWTRCVTRSRRQATSAKNRWIRPPAINCWRCSMTGNGLTANVNCQLRSRWIATGQRR